MNDLAQQLDQAKLKSYFYADDLAILLHGYDELKKTTNIIEHWIS